jgi:nitrate reductase gamma subunit
MSILLRGALPCVAFALPPAGVAWRYRRDTYGWTTRSCQIHQ